MQTRIKPLALRRETVRELSRQELGAAAGGVTQTCTCHLLTGIYPSINVECTTILSDLQASCGVSCTSCR